MILSLCICFSNKTDAQNLVPNPDFEEFDMICPIPFTLNGIMPCAPWLENGTANYFHECDGGPCGVPSNFRGTQFAHSGFAYVGGYQKGGLNEIVYAELLEPLETGQCYEVTYYASCAEDGCGIDRLGAYFTDNPSSFWEHPPQIDVQMEYFSDYNLWMPVYGTFVANGGETHIAIGNFYPGSQTNYDPTCPNPPLFAYYYFDDVSVVAVETFPLDVELGGPYVECTSFTLDPQIPDAIYHWSDGSTGPVLVVTESGLYSVTVSTTNCEFGMDEVEVTILGSPSVVLDPFVDLCLGDIYEIDLDESLGEYIWQDGTTGGDYTITDAGTYSVTLDDGCDLTSAQVVVTTFVFPAFELPDDTLLCGGDMFSIVMDPTLGNFHWQDNSGASTYTIDDPGIYSLTVSNVCGEAEDEMEVTTIEPPEFTFGQGPVLLCNGESISYSFDPGMGEYLWDDGSTLSEATFSEAGLYSLTITNECGTDSESIAVDTMTTPVVDLGEDLTICAGDLLILSVDPGMGSIVWQNGSTEPTFSVPGQGNYSVTITNACGSSDDNLFVQEIQLIDPVNLGPDIIACTGEVVTLSINEPGASIQWSDGSIEDILEVTTSGTYFVDVTSLCQHFSDTIVIDIGDYFPDVQLPDDILLCQNQSILLSVSIPNGTYAWNTGAQTSQVLITSPGIYMVTATNNCGVDADTILIQDGGPAPAVDLGIDTSICNGSSFTLSPTFSNVSNWMWMDDSVNPTFTVTAPGLIFVQVGNSCGMAFDTMMIGTLPDVPSFSLGPDTLVCPQTSILYTIIVPDVSIQWNDGTVLPSLLVTDSMQLIASISNVCGTESDTTVIAWLPQLPLLELGPDQNLCTGEVIIIAPNLSNVNYAWQDGSTNDSLLVTQAGQVILMISDDCNNAIDTLEIIESNLGPQLELGPDIHGCQDDTITLNAGISGVQYQWQDGTTLSTFEATISGEYILAVNNSCGADQDTIHVLLDGLPPQTILGPDTTFCNGLTLLLHGDLDPSTTSLWQDGSTADIFTVSVSGLYILTESNECGIDRDSILITIDGNAPVTNLGPDTLLCEGNTFLLHADTDSTTSATWQDGSTSESYMVVVSGTYVLTETNICGSDRDTIEIEVNGMLPSLSLGPDTSLCEGETLILKATVDPSTTLEWQDGSNTDQFIVQTAGLYILRATNHCGAGSDSIEVDFVDAPPPFELGNDTILCPGDSYILFSPVTGFEMQWQDASHGNQTLVNGDIVYSLQISNECGVQSDSLAVSFDTRIPHVELDDHILWCPGDTIILSATQIFPATYLWNTGAVDPEILVTDPGAYSVEVAAPCASAGAEVIILTDVDCDELPNFYIPNIISPNGDQVNDIFSVIPNDDIEIINSNLDIFDRWGNMVYTSTSFPFNWDGRFHEQYVLPGVYVYVLNFTYEVNGIEKHISKAGDLTVVR